MGKTFWQASALAITLSLAACNKPPEKSAKIYLPDPAASYVVRRVTLFLVEPANTVAPHYEFHVNGPSGVKDPEYDVVDQKIDPDENSLMLPRDPKEAEQTLTELLGYPCKIVASADLGNEPAIPTSPAKWEIVDPKTKQTINCDRFFNYQSGRWHGKAVGYVLDPYAKPPTVRSLRLHETTLPLRGGTFVQPLEFGDPLSMRESLNRALLVTVEFGPRPAPVQPKIPTEQQSKEPSQGRLPQKPQNQAQKSTNPASTSK